AGHDAVVSAPGTVGVEILRRNTFFLQVFAGGAVRRDASGRGDVVRGDGIAQQSQCPRAADLLDRLHFRRQVDEEGRLLDVGGIFVPVVQVPLRRGHVVPALVGVEDAGVLPPELI